MKRYRVHIDREPVTASEDAVVTAVRVIGKRWEVTAEKGWKGHGYSLKEMNQACHEQCIEKGGHKEVAKSRIEAVES